MSLLTRVSRAAGGALLRATAAGRHRCSKAQHHPQRVHRRLACAGAGKMGVAGSCRRGNTDQDSDGGGSPVSGRKMSTHSNNGCIGDLVEGVICQEDDLPKDGNDRAASVTVIGNTSVPFEYSLGHDVGQRIQEMFEEKGVKFIAKSGVVGISEDEGKASGVTLDSGETVEADVVVLGVGVVPNTEFLETSSIPRNQRGYIPVNEHLETSIPGVFCGGDIAAFPLFIEGGEEVSIGHWQVALGHGHTAALNMTGQNVAVKSVPFFWTVLYGKSLRYTGYGKYDNVIIGGDLENLSFIAYYCRGDKVVSLASLGKDPAAANYAEMLQQGKFLTKQQVVDDGEIALKLKC
ncbi:Apoptosis-inducing factor 3 [Portunus trituberculatus]|uniref:Apoptosis-inducing factor 3 n=1 Tax=Portunus trituberculatus TaxID=210409 RepID=A0A5B7DMS1_PORTR|nr:Apoptosis-inducing factor 3 [Portunus trituberculatus]